MAEAQPIQQTDVSKTNTPIKDAIIEFIIKYGMLVAIVILILYFNTQSDVFLSVSNFLLIARAVSILTIVAIGISLSVSVGGFDVSVGAVTGLSVILSTSLMVIWEVPWHFAIIIAIVTGGIVGIVNSFLIIKLKIPDLLATLGMLYLTQGLQMTITKGDSVYRNMVNPWSPTRETVLGEIPDVFKEIGQGFVFSTDNFDGIPIAVIIMIIIAIVFHVFLQYTRWGRMLYAVGGNQEAARLSGIPINRVRAGAYVLSGMLAATAGIVLASRIGSGAVKAGDPYLLDGVAATFFGFAVLGARRPNVFGTVLGALFVGIMLNGLTMMNLSWFYQDMIKGFVLIASLALSFYLVKSEH